jgi:hypothetical protein
MLPKMKYQESLCVFAALCIGVLCISYFYITPASAQGRGFMGKYSYTLTLEGIDLEGEFSLYETYSNGSLETFFDSYDAHYIVHRPDYRLQSEGSGYVDIMDQYSYTSISGKLIRSETTYSIHLTGYQQVIVTSMYEYGNYYTITDNETLFEETYTGVYYEDGVYVESVDYHEYTFLIMENESAVLTEEVGGYECIVLDTYTFEGFDTDIDEPSDWDYYQGGQLVWIDTENGYLVQQWQFDEYDDIVARILLLSMDEPNTPPPLFGGSVDFRLVIVGGVGVAALIGVLVFVKSRRGRSEQHTDYYTVGPGISDY